MFHPTFAQLYATVALGAVAVMGCIFLRVLLQRPRGRGADAPARRAGTADTARFAHALDQRLDQPAASPAPRAPRHAADDEARFRAVAKRRLEPLLDEFVRHANAHGHRAHCQMETASGHTSYRLEVERSERLEGQLQPAISFSCASAGKVSMTYSGVYPGPADHNGADAEIGWRDVDWDDVDKVLLHFADRTFRRYPRAADA